MIPELTHASYVWTSYGIFAAVVAWQFAQPLIHRRKLENQLREMHAERAAARRAKS